jgi:hypothetical protein
VILLYYQFGSSYLKKGEIKMEQHSIQNFWQSQYGTPVSNLGPHKVRDDWGYEADNGGCDGDCANCPDYVEDYIPDQVFYNGNSTTVKWQDGSKTTVTCSDREPFIAEVGLAMAIVKKLYGNRAEFLRWVREAYYQPEKVKKVKKSKEPEITWEEVLTVVGGAKNTNFAYDLLSHASVSEWNPVGDVAQVTVKDNFTSEPE